MPRPFALILFLGGLLAVAAACSTATSGTPIPGANAGPAVLPTGEVAFTVSFRYKRTITGKATGNDATVEEDNSESYNGDLRCVANKEGPAGIQFSCAGPAQATYVSKGSCLRQGKTNLHTEEAKPWQGQVQAALTFESPAAPQANWTFTVEAPPMQIHVVDVEFEGKRTEDDAEFQVVPDLIGTGALSADGKRGVWTSSGENVDELIFGECETGVKSETEKGDATITVTRP